MRFCPFFGENDDFSRFYGILEENMETFLFVAMIALLALGVLLTVAVLMQHGKSYGLSGTIAGGAETFFGKDKGGRIDKALEAHYLGNLL